MTRRDFFNRPKNVFGLIAALVAVWLLFNPAVLNNLLNRVVMPLLMQGLVIGLMIWGIKIMIFGPKKNSGNKK